MIKINIDNIKISTIIGTNPEERNSPQEITVNLCFDYPGDEAINEDDLSSAVDYEKMLNTINSRVEKASFYLIETLADFILKIIFEELKVQKASVEVIKTNALKNADSVRATISASKNN